MENVRVRLECRGGLYEGFATIDEAKQMVLVSSRGLGRYRGEPRRTATIGIWTSWKLGARVKPVARILIPLAD
jgi:hypothetical protein